MSDDICSQLINLFNEPGPINWKLAAEAARAANAQTPMGDRAAQLYQKFVDDGHAGTDFSGIIKMLNDQA